MGGGRHPDRSGRHLLPQRPRHSCQDRALPPPRVRWVQTVVGTGARNCSWCWGTRATRAGREHASAGRASRQTHTRVHACAHTETVHACLHVCPAGTWWWCCVLGPCQHTPFQGRLAPRECVSARDGARGRRRTHTQQTHTRTPVMQKGIWRGGFVARDQPRRPALWSEWGRSCDANV